jgi:tRNA nucleotidyltransferase (CCA-adding enzyme)
LKRILPDNLIQLAKICKKPLYVVGGSVRDFLCGLRAKKIDFDVTGAMLPDEFIPYAAKVGLSAKSVYRHTGTVKLTDGDGNEYEYACFRSDKYVRGEHTPAEIYFTDDIVLDAKRRDFTANAVYYDVKAKTFVDPLGGIPAIQERRLTCVDRAEKVFGEDGLRLMRLARFHAQLGFIPDKACLQGAKKNAELINDVSIERVFAELQMILRADEKYGVQGGHYKGLKLLEEIGVLAQILPELTLGKGLSQRADFHNHDVLEHSLRAVLYAPARLRLSALLHDVGKPFCMLRDGKYANHPVEGERIAGEVLSRWKAPKKEITFVQTMVKWHMYDFNCETGENKLRRFFVEHAPLLDDFIAVKQADFSACKDDLSPCPTGEKWKALLAKMKAEKVPFTLKELAVSGKTLAEIGIPERLLATTLKALLLHTATNPADNTPERLVKIAFGMMR